MSSQDPAERERRTNLFINDFCGGDPNAAPCREVLPMAPRSNPTIPPHTACLYDMCDVLDTLSDTTLGRSYAEQFAKTMMKSLVESFPAASLKAFKGDDMLVASYKNAHTFKAAPDPVAQALQRLAQAAQAAGQYLPDTAIVNEIEALVTRLNVAASPNSANSISELATKVFLNGQKGKRR